MKVGYYKNDLEKIEADSIEEAAELYADKNHQIDEESDMNFTLYVEDDDGEIYEVKLYTEYDPSYYVDEVIT